MKQSKLQAAIHKAIMDAFKQRAGDKNVSNELIAHTISEDMAHTAAVLGIVEGDIVTIKEVPVVAQLAEHHSDGVSRREIKMAVLRTVYGVVWKKQHWGKMKRTKERNQQSSRHYKVPPGFMCANDFPKVGLSLTLAQIKRLAKQGHLPAGVFKDGFSPMLWETKVVKALAQQVNELVDQELEKA